MREYERGRKTENIQEEFTRAQNESQSAYLSRSTELLGRYMRDKKLVASFFDPHRAREEHLPPVIVSFIESICLQARREDSLEHLQPTDVALLPAIERSIGAHYPNVRPGKMDEEAFDKTQRSRSFFDVQPGKGAAKRESYWNTLFFPYNIRATRALAKETLDNKNILLFGGGRSHLTEEMTQQGIAPTSIVNIDPFVSEPEPGADRVIPVSATDPHLFEFLQTQGIQPAQEIWAEYSVPAYLEDTADILQLFRNVDALLAVGGSARIWPLEVRGADNDADIDVRKTALMCALQELTAAQNYEIILRKAVGRYGITLHKLSSSFAV